MNSRIVEDYIVLKAGETDKSDNYIKHYEDVDRYRRLVIRHERQIVKRSEQFTCAKALLEEYRQFEKLETGKRYKVLSKEENEIWDNKWGKKKGMYSLPRHTHPLASYEDGREFIIFGQPIDDLEKQNYEEFLEDCKSMVEGLKKIEESLKFIEKELLEFQGKLEEKLNNESLNPLNFERSSFENLVKMYLDRGFEPLGGVSVSNGSLYQAMVRYKS